MVPTGLINCDVKLTKHSHPSYWPRKRLTLNFALLCRMPSIISITTLTMESVVQFSFSLSKFAFVSRFVDICVLYCSISGYYSSLTSQRAFCMLFQVTRVNVYIRRHYRTRSFINLALRLILPLQLLFAYALCLIHNYTPYFTLVVLLITPTIHPLCVMT